MFFDLITQVSCHVIAASLLQVMLFLDYVVYHTNVTMRCMCIYWIIHW